MKCDILYLCGQLDYGDSVSGNYILYKLLKNIDDVSLKVLPLFIETKQKIDKDDFLQYIFPSQENIGRLLEIIPEHKILVLSGDDFPLVFVDYICTKYKSKLVTISMTHWLYGNTVAYPELENDFDGINCQKRLEVFQKHNAHIINGSTFSTLVHEQSMFRNIKNVLLPFPFQEIDIDESFIKNDTKEKKIILWGTTQPNTPRKGKDYFENILDWLSKKVDTNKILIKTIGPKEKINTKFEVEYLGVIPNRFELSKIYKDVDVFALTTLADAGPMMATECVRNSTPLVSFATNVSMDFVQSGKNGYIVNGTEEFAEKIYEILFNKNYHIDLNYVKNFNSEEIVYKKYNEFFKNILNDNIS